MSLLTAQQYADLRRDAAHYQAHEKLGTMISNRISAMEDAELPVLPGVFALSLAGAREALAALAKAAA